MDDKTNDQIPEEKPLPGESKPQVELPENDGAGTLGSSEAIPLEGEQDLTGDAEPIFVEKRAEDIAEDMKDTSPDQELRSPADGWFEELNGFTRSTDDPVKVLPDVGNEPVNWRPEEEIDTPETNQPSDPAAQVMADMTPEEQNFASDDIEQRPIVPPRMDEIPTQPPPAGVNLNGTDPELALPKRVFEVDPHATRVSPVAYDADPGIAEESNIPSFWQKKVDPVPEGKINPKANGKKGKKKKSPRRVGCFIKVLLLLVFVVIFIALIVGSIGIYQYFRIASSLPGVEELRARASQFETTRILDREGNILYEIVDPNAGKRTFVPLEEMSPYIVAATLATEDKEFYNHPGYDLVALARALWQNYTAGEITSGASTITQQLARMLLLPDERFEQSYERKAREIVLAAEITRQYSKEEILEMYLNEIFYANLSYGIEAAAETYFRTTASQLTLWQSSFLAGLPQAPAIYDIYNNREATLARNRDVLVLMYNLSVEKNCIYISTNLERVCVDAVQALNAAQTLEAYQFTSPTYAMRYPHWVVYVQSLLEQQYDPQTIYRSGFTVYTTLDPQIQRAAEEAVNAQIQVLAANNATNAAVMVIQPATGEILGMVGSADFYNADISGQVNMALTDTRQPGSSIKPITYLAAFEKGWTPSTLIWDVPTDFTPSGIPDDPVGLTYSPVNYDGKYHGPVTIRAALANSYNVPAVKTLQFVGIYDDPNTAQKEGMIAMAERLGITSLKRSDYGLSLTLGGGEVSLKEMTSAYAVMANAGRKVDSVAITRIVDFNGNEIYQYEAPSGDQVLRVEHAYLISSIMSDVNARIPMFGTNPVINLPFTAAAKTGTTNDFRDNWTIGYTPDLVVGVWVGNADYTPMLNTSGLMGAAPIWAEVMKFGIQELTGGNPSPFIRPAGIVDRVICSVSGAEPSNWCPEQRSEIYASDQLPLPKEKDLWAKVTIDTWTGLTASPACANYTVEKFAINVTDSSAIKWLRQDAAGISWAEKYGFSSPLFFAPPRECTESDPRPIIEIVGLISGQTINASPLEINGVIDATANFKDYKIEYGEGEQPNIWKPLVENVSIPIRSTSKIYEWDLKDVAPGAITIKITLFSTNETYAEKKIVLFFAVATETPTPTPTMTQTETPTLTPTVTETPIVIPTRTPIPTDTPTPVPMTLAEISFEVITALKASDMNRLAEFVHPSLGLRFSPYAYISDNDLVFQKVAIPSIMRSPTTYTWGTYLDGSGTPIELKFKDYYPLFVYSADFANPDQKAFNQSIGQGNTINNLTAYYPGAEFVEYHFTGFDPQLEGKDWQSLRLVFLIQNGKYYLLGIVHDQWTI